ncbi:MAG: putative septation inhibitor protein, partial [Marmoricola sp.]|nr:putative septation inhibitor protein [Marmoricola sp.]
MSKPAARKPTVTVSGYETSLVRCAIVVVLVLAGIAWMTVYTHAAMDHAEFTHKLLFTKTKNPLPWMSHLYKWNYAIGFGAIFVGLVLSAHAKTPLGRGRGVVVGMLGCFGIGLVWIITYYFAGQSTNFNVPVMDKLDQLNLLVGVGFMA